MSKTVTLRDFKDRQGSSYLGATLNADGDLPIIEGGDSGDGVEQSFGRGHREYEWSHTVRAADIPALLDALGGDDVLAALQQHFSGMDSYKLQPFLDAHRIPYEFWSRVGN